MANKTVTEVLEKGVAGYLERENNIQFERNMYERKIAKNKPATNNLILKAETELDDYKTRFLKYIANQQ